MFLLRFTVVLAASSLFNIGLMQAQSLYHEPQGRFSLAVPSGWTHSDGPGTFQMRNGETFVMVMVIDGQGSSRDLLTSVAEQVKRVWTGFKTIGSPESVKLGNEPAAFELEFGVNPSGVKSFAAIYAITNGEMGFVMTQTGPAYQFISLRSELDGIAASFSLESQRNGKGGTHPPSSPVPRPLDSESYGGSAAFYESPDHSLTCLLPPGWQGRVTSLGSDALYVLEPTDSSEQSIFVSVGSPEEEDIKHATQQVITSSTQAIPGLRPSSSPTFSQAGAEIRYGRQTKTGMQIWWQEIRLKDRRAVAVTCGGRADGAEALHEKCVGVSRSVRLAAVSAQETSQLASSLVGRWEFYSRSDATQGSVERHLAISANGQFEYSSTVYIPNAPSSIDPTTRESGTYRVQGNTITAQTVGGKTLTFPFELLDGGRALLLGGQKYLRE